MAQINQFLLQSELALAAYANLFAGMTGAQMSPALKLAGMTEAGAEAFANRYTVVDQINDTTGLSATVFQDSSGKRYLAIRGTESLGDFVANAFILAGWPSFLNPQFLTLRAQVQRWMDSGVLPSSYTIAGHSLGGYLAAAVGSWFGANNAGTFLLNAPGVGGVGGNATDSFRAATGLGNVALVDGIQNIRASSGSSLIAGLGLQLAPPLFIETEFSSDPFANHSILPITDSLSVYALLEQLNPAIGVDEVAEIFKTASNLSADTLVSVVAPLARIFGGDENLASDREGMYRAIYSIEAQVPADGTNPFKLVPLIDQDAETLANAANVRSADGLAYRYALSELNPFVVLGADYSQLNVSGALDIYDPETGVGFTQAYLNDRATMLSWKNDNFREDGNIALRSNHIETQQFTDKTIRDEKTGGDLSLTVVGSQLSAINNPSKVIFGGNDADVLMGGDIAAGDRLYGGGGDDTLQGNRGDDYLEGGAGDDTYIWNTGDGFDTILDADSSGRLVVNGVPVSGAIQVSANEYFSADKKLAMHFDANPGSAGVLIVNGDIRIEGFESGDLGIVLGNGGDASQFHPAGSIFANPFSQTYPTIGFGTNGADYADVGADSIFLAKGGDDFLVVTGTGGAKLFAGPGDDLIVGGDLPADDAVSAFYGEAGADILLGGEKNESIFGDFGIVKISASGFAVPSFSFIAPNFLFGDSSGYGYWGWLDDFRSYEVDYSETPVEPFAGSYIDAFKFALGIADDADLGTYYDDYIEGGGGNDRITGGNGSDVLFGGGGDDVLIGDGLLLLPQDSFPTPQWLTDLLPLFGAPGDDYLDGGPGNDVLEDGISGNGGSGGNDVLIGGEGNDILTNMDPDSDSQPYTNYLDGGNGDDILQSNNGSLNGMDTLVGGPGNDSLTVVTRGSTYMSGGAGDDSLTLGALCNADMEGGAGSDSYFLTFFDSPLSESFYPGVSPGNVVIREQDLLGFDHDSLSISMCSIGVLPLSITRDASNLYVGAETIPHWLTIENWFSGTESKIEEIFLSFTDFNATDPLPQQAYDIAAIESLFSTATDQPDFLWGSGAIDQIAGGPGDDTIFGAGGDDILAGNEGEDILDGGDGSDVYVFNIGDGTDYISDSGRAGSDSISFGAGITREMLSFDPNLQLLTVGDNGDVIHLAGSSLVDTGGFSSIDYLQFADGSSLSFRQFINPDLDIEAAGDSVTSAVVADGNVSGQSGGSNAPGSGQGGGGTGTGSEHSDDAAVGGSALSSSELGEGGPEGNASPPVSNTEPDAFSASWQIEQGYQFEQAQFAGGAERDVADKRNISLSNVGSQFDSEHEESDRIQAGQPGSEQSSATGKTAGDIGDRKYQGRRDQTLDLLGSFFADQPHFDFKNFENGWGNEARREQTLTPTEVAARWQRIDQYMKDLAESQDEDARRGATDLHPFDTAQYLGSDGPAGAFGFAGSTGATNGYAKLKTLQGLNEGFQLLRN